MNNDKNKTRLSFILVVLTLFISTPVIAVNYDFNQSFNNVQAGGARYSIIEVEQPIRLTGYTDARGTGLNTWSVIYCDTINFCAGSRFVLGIEHNPFDGSYANVSNLRSLILYPNQQYAIGRSTGTATSLYAQATTALPITDGLVTVVASGQTASYITNELWSVSSVDYDLIDMGNVTSYNQVNNYINGDTNALGGTGDNFVGVVYELNTSVDGIIYRRAFNYGFGAYPMENWSLRNASGEIASGEWSDTSFDEGVLDYAVYNGELEAGTYYLTMYAPVSMTVTGSNAPNFPYVSYNLSGVPDGKGQITSTYDGGNIINTDILFIEEVLLIENPVELPILSNVVFHRSDDTGFFNTPQEAVPIISGWGVSVSYNGGLGQDVIRWFVNGVLIQDAVFGYLNFHGNDNDYPIPAYFAGDIITAEITASDGIIFETPENYSEVVSTFTFSLTSNFDILQHPNGLTFNEQNFSLMTFDTEGVRYCRFFIDGTETTVDSSARFLPLTRSFPEIGVIFDGGTRTFLVRCFRDNPTFFFDNFQIETEGLITTEAPTPLIYFTIYAQDSVTINPVLSYTVQVFNEVLSEDYSTMNGEIVTLRETNTGLYNVVTSSDCYETFVLEHDSVTDLTVSITPVNPSLLNNIPTQTLNVGDTETINLDSFVDCSSRYELEVYEYDTDLNGTGTILGESTGIYSLENNFFNITLNGSQVIARGVNVPHNFSVGVTAFHINGNSYDLQRYDYRTIESLEPTDLGLGFTFDTSDAKFWLFVMVSVLLIVGTVFLKGYYIGYIGGLYFLYFAVQFLNSAYSLPVVFPVVFLAVSVILLAVESQN